MSRESRGSFATVAASRTARTPTDSSEFTRLTRAVGNNVQKIQSNVQQMKSLLSDLNRKPDNTSKLAELHEIQQKTNNLVKETRQKVQDLNELPPHPESPEQRRMKIQKDRLMNDFSKAVDSFQIVQRQEKEKAKAQVLLDRQSVKRMRKPPQVEPTTEDEEPAFGQKGQVLVLTEISDIELELMKEREEELQQLEADIRDVHEIFQDLGKMIHEQGEVIDTIESNVESAAVHVETGRKDLASAHDNATKARKKKLCIIIVVSVVVAVIIIIIVLASVLSKK